MSAVALEQADPTLEQLGTVYLLEDNVLEGLVLAQALRSVGIEVVNFSDATEFLEKFDAEKANCVVIDFHLQQQTGLDVLRSLRNQGCFTPFLIVTGYPSVSMAVSSMRAGAVNVLEKPVMPKVLLNAVQTAISFDRAYRERNTSRTEILARLGLLSRRELEVLQLVLEGRTTKEIAKSLGIANKTVDVHRSNIVRKLNVESIAEVLRNLYSNSSTEGTPDVQQLIMRRLAGGE